MASEIALVGKGNLSTGRSYTIAIMSILILVGIGSSMSYAKAETINIYVQEMPRSWQDQFSDVLPNAIQYWENKTPNLKFSIVQNVEKSDFVVEWASQFEGGKLGYYSEGTANGYSKPIMVITLGFFKDKKWHLAPSESVLQITKHELGHAIGLPDSTDPNNIMFPIVKDYEALQLESVQNVQAPDTGADVQSDPVQTVQASSVSTSVQSDPVQNVQASSVSTSVQSDPVQNVQASSVTIDWYERSEKYQKIASEKILLLTSKIDETQSLLSSVSYSSNAANDELNSAQTAFVLAKEYFDNAEKMQTDGGSAILQSNYYDSYRDFKSSYDYAKKVEQKLAQITQHIAKASSLA